MFTVAGVGALETVVFTGTSQGSLSQVSGVLSCPPPQPSPTTPPHAGKTHSPEQRKFKLQALRLLWPFQDPGKSPGPVFSRSYVFVRFAKGMYFNHSWGKHCFCPLHFPSSYFSSGQMALGWPWAFEGVQLKGKLNWECIEFAFGET